MPSTRVLYYPYIRVPASAWFNQMLLYWDTVCTITPHEFIENPKKLDDHTRFLVKEGLVEQIVPGQYAFLIPNFEESFLNYLQGLGEKEILARQEAFSSLGKSMNIHVDKLDALSEMLQAMRLARRVSRSWVEVQRETALEFMEYLAACLGRLEPLSALPITDESGYLGHFISKSKTLEDLEALRVRVLGDLLPSPGGPINPSELAEFKGKHGEELSRFRRRVELELLDAIALDDEALRNRRIEIFLDQSMEEIQHIKDLMARSGWVRTNIIRLSAVVPAIPGVGPLTGLAFAVLSAFGGRADYDDRSPFLYAAEAHHFAP